MFAGIVCVYVCVHVCTAKCLLVTCYLNVSQGDESIAVSVQPDSTDGLYTARQPAYTDYIPLWTKLMDPSEMKARVQCVCACTYS